MTDVGDDSREIADRMERKLLESGEGDGKINLSQDANTQVDKAEDDEEAEYKGLNLFARLFKRYNHTMLFALGM